jgi:hypothetical protein
MALPDVDICLFGVYIVWVRFVGSSVLYRYRNSPGSRQVVKDWDEGRAPKPGTYPLHTVSPSKRLGCQQHEKRSTGQYPRRGYRRSIAAQMRSQLPTF